MKLLAVDDDPLILELLTEVLRAAGFGNLTICSSATKALAEIDRANVAFDCFLVDIQMPEIDGIELTAQIRKIEKYRNTPILIITAMSDRSYMDRAFYAGASDYITKPFDVMAIHSRLRLIQSLVNKKHSLEERNLTSQLKSPTSIVTSADLEKRLPLQEIDGFIDYLALENYLLQVSHVSLFGVIVFGIVVPDIARAFRTSSVFEFEAAISDFAEAISGSLKPESFFASHAGEGHFVCVLPNPYTFALEAFKVQLDQTVRDMDLHFCDGRAMSLTPTVGEAISLQFKSSRGISNALVQALRSAEARAQNLYAQDRIPSSKLLHLLGFG